MICYLTINLSLSDGGENAVSKNQFTLSILKKWRRKTKIPANVVFVLMMSIEHHLQNT